MILLLTNVYQILGIVPDLQKVEWKKIDVLLVLIKFAFCSQYLRTQAEEYLKSPTLDVSALWFHCDSIVKLLLLWLLLLLFDTGSMARTVLESLISLGWPGLTALFLPQLLEIKGLGL